MKKIELLEKIEQTDLWWNKWKQIFDCRWRNFEVKVKKFGDGRRNFKVKKR